MKKFAFAALLCVLPLCLTACGSAVPLVIQPNWYKNTGLKDNVEGTEERLVYRVSSVPAPRDGYSAEYADGTYTTELSVKSLTLSDGTTREGYAFDAHLTVGVRFSYNGEQTSVYQEEEHSHVEFLPAGSRLSPVSSHREVHCHAPVEYPASGNLFTEFHYSYDISYTIGDNDTVTAANVTYTDLKAAAEPTTAEYEIEEGSTYLDNEEIAFALRGVSSFVTFRTFNTSMSRVLDVELRASMSEEARAFPEISWNGTKSERAINTYRYELGYGLGIGTGATLVYAKKTSETENEYRNVLLTMELPILRALGTIVYTLSEATFNDK